MNKIRSEHGAVVTPMSMVIRELINYRKKGKLTFSAYLSDQTPARSEIQYWTTFLGQETPVYLGAEKIAVKYDMAVVFLNIQKLARGYYCLEFELLFEHTDGLPEYHITETHVRRLDRAIREKPEYWIWSHRRWKHKREARNG
jgi:KDO2-lipid IV(A) lauroyltransferase